MSIRQQSFEHVEPRPPDSAPGAAALTDYGRSKLELSELIRGAMNLASERDDDARKTSARELLARLAEDRFQIAVVGQFSRGKSTVMNAILGRAYLPTGALPMTSVVTSVRYGSRPRVTVRRRGGRLPIDSSLADLVRFVAQASAEREELQVVSAEVAVPAEILRLGFYFIDTPGIGSAVAANTATAERFLPEADAVIFVTGFDAPLGEAELGFLTEVRRNVEKLFFVVNKRDLVSPGEADEIVRFVRARLAERSDDCHPRVFAISARDGLEAKLDGRGDALIESGLPPLEQSLVAFLTTERARVLLLQVCGRAERLIGQLRLDLELGRAVAARKATERDAVVAAFGDSIEEVVSEQRRVAGRLAERVAAELPRVLADRLQPSTDELRRIALAEVDGQSPPPPDARSASDWAREAASHAEDAAPRLFERWVTRSLAQARSLLVALAPAELAELHSLRDSVERLASESFGVSSPPTGIEPTWSPADLPELAIEAVPFTLAVQLPRRTWLRSGSRGEPEARARLETAIDVAAAAYGVEVQVALVRAAQRWVQDMAAGIERATRGAADRVRANARDPATEDQVATLADLERTLTEFRARIPRPQASGTGEPGEEARNVRVNSRPESASRCVICERVAGVPFRYMAHAQWELARRGDRRAEHAQRGGFCAMHTWQYAEIASELGIALAYAPLAESAADLIGLVDPPVEANERLKRSLAELMPGADRCPACLALARAEQDAVSEVVDGLPSRADGAAAPPLCVQHLAAVLDTGPEGEWARLFAERLANTLQLASDDMRRYSLKREALRDYLLSDEEEAAPMRAVSYLAGHRELVRPWRRRDEIG